MVFSNSDQALLPGLFARVRVPVSAPQHALLVSERAVGTDQNQKFVLTLGEDGARLDGVAVPAFPAQAVDTTGAGDAFTAAFAVALADGLSDLDAVRWGCAAGAHMVEHSGVVPGLPTRAEVEQRLVWVSA